MLVFPSVLRGPDKRIGKSRAVLVLMLYAGRSTCVATWPQVAEAEVTARQAAAEAVERRAEAIKAEAETQANRILADARAEKERQEERSRQLQESNQRLSLSLSGMHAQSPQTAVRLLAT